MMSPQAGEGTSTPSVSLPVLVPSSKSLTGTSEKTNPLSFLGTALTRQVNKQSHPGQISGAHVDSLLGTLLGTWN